MSASSAEVTSPQLEAEVPRDPIPIPVLIVIFGVIAVMLWWLMYATWERDWHTYQKNSLLRKHEYKEAITHLQWLLNSNTPARTDTEDTMKNPTFLSELGLCYMHSGDYQKAEEFYRRAQQYNVNMTTDEQGNVREATDFLPEIGEALYRRGDLKGAEATLLDALKKNKVHPKANFLLGEIEMKRGNYVNAAKYFKVVARNPWYGAKVKEYYAEIEKKLFAPAA